MVRTAGNYVIVIIAVILLLLLGGCKEEVVRRVTRNDDDFVMEHYTNAKDAYKETEYEKITDSLEMRGFDVSIGPKEPEYRGMIRLTDEKAKELQDGYDWNKAEKVEIAFEQMEYKIPEEGEWYVSKAFEHDYFKLVSVYDAYFDGKNTILYDIRTN